MLKKTIISIAISAVIGGAVALAPLDAFARGGGGGGGHGGGGGGHGGGGFGGGDCFRKMGQRAIKKRAFKTEQ